MQLTQHGVGITCILTVLDTVLGPSLSNETRSVSVRYIYVFNFFFFLIIIVFLSA